jgi:hypothetical protein
MNLFEQSNQDVTTQLVNQQECADASDQTKSAINSLALSSEVSVTHVSSTLVFQPGEADWHRRKIID